LLAGVDCGIIAVIVDLASWDRPAQCNAEFFWEDGVDETGGWDIGSLSQERPDPGPRCWSSSSES
jgi:hypothetical protein